MSTTTINLSSFINGQATDLTTIKLQDSSATYGVKRTDTMAVVVASGVSFTRLAEGAYQYVFTDPASGLTYNYTIRIQYGGVTYYYNRVGQSNSVISHIYAIPVNTYYSSEAEVMRQLGEMAVKMMLEDWEDTDASPVWNDILSYVDETIDRWVGQRYAHAALLSNAYIRRRATILAANMISTRRGNPGLYMRATESIMEELNDIRAGIIHINGAVPMARFAPVVRNYQMQPLAYHPQRVITTKSTGQSYARMDVSWEPYFITLPL